jgi:hypothetical protein
MVFAVAKRTFSIPAFFFFLIESKKYFARGRLQHRNDRAGFLFGAFFARVCERLGQRLGSDFTGPLTVDFAPSLIDRNASREHERLAGGARRGRGAADDLST